MPKYSESQNLVLHIITGLGTGGAETMLYKLTKQDSKKFASLVVSLTTGGKYKPLLEQHGIEVLELDLKKVWRLPLHLWSIFQLVRHRNVRMLHAWMYHAVFVASLIKLLFPFRQIPLIWNIRHSLSDIKNETRAIRFLIRVLRYFTWIPKVILFNSNQSINQHTLYWRSKNKSVFIPNGFDLERWAPSANDVNSSKEHFLGVSSGRFIVHVGRAHPMKNHAGLIEAFLCNAAIHEDIHLVLIGKGTENLIIQKVKGSERIHLLGERHDVSKIIPMCDFFILCSSWGEGFPNVLGEAMACELVCGTTDVGDSSYVIGDIRFSILPNQQNDLNMLVGRLLSLTQQECSKIGADNRMRVMRHFSIEQIVERYHDIYASLCKFDGTVNEP